MSPELHPAVVHFPIALLVAGALLSWWECARTRLEESVDLVVALAFLSAIFASWSGQGAFASLELSPGMTAAVRAHEGWGTWTVWLAGVSCGVRLALRWHRHRTRRSRYSRVWGTGAALVCTFAAALALATGYRGGDLVHSLGVTPSAVPRKASAPVRDFDGFQAAPRDSLEP